MPGSPSCFYGGDWIFSILRASRHGTSSATHECPSEQLLFGVTFHYFLSDSNGECSRRIFDLTDDYTSPPSVAQ